ncbi:hypothetical protein DT603_00555 [Pseudoxanthomonas gei]|uniref:Uncharacterized protein n=1 Tax=Pseudoxanthomonas gei TaxID=1383030 RepID=A0ABX0AAM7_9GAMM|nr:hypothetical protein [Pseudoxanthomonas gei]NDK37336.1 hypothetical protein [Pseudoxanthomonas gei]
MTDFSWLDATADQDWQSQSNGSCFRQMKWSEFCLRSHDGSTRQVVVDRFDLWADHHPLHNYSLAWDQPCSLRSDVYICRDSRLNTRPREH